MRDWTEEQHKRFTLFTRYHTTAERSFLRYFKEIEAYHHRIHHDDQARELAFAKLALIQFKSLDKADAAALKELRAEQVVEVQIMDGVCRSYFYPGDRELIELAAQRPTPPLYITRWILFPQDIAPSEYAWARPLRIEPGVVPRVMQRMLWPQWLELIERENSGHASPLHS